MMVERKNSDSSSDHNHSQQMNEFEKALVKSIGKEEIQIADDFQFKQNPERKPSNSIKYVSFEDEPQQNE